MSESNDNPPLRRPIRWGRWIGFSFLGLIVLLIAAHAFWGGWQEKKLQEEIAALRASGESVLLEELASKPVPDADNAVTLLRSAGQSLDENSPAWQEFSALELGVPLTRKEIDIVANVVDANRGALAKLRQARSKTGVDWRVDLARLSIITDNPDIKQQRMLATLAGAAILLEHHRGNDREAVELTHDLLAQSAAVEQMPMGLIPHLVGIGISAIAVDRACAIVPDLRIGNKEGEVPAAEVKKLIDALLQEKQLKDGQRLAFRVERAFELQLAQSLKSAAAAMNIQQQKGLAVMQYVGRPLLLRDGRLMLRHATVLLKAADEAGDFPKFQEATKAQMQQVMSMIGSPGHMLLAMLVPALDRPVERTFRVIVERRLAATALAMRLYALEHDGRFPATLDELTPRYLPQVPGDALAAGKPIIYVPDAHKPRIYSVGANGKDDGGSDTPVKGGFGRWGEEDAVVHLTRQPRKSQE